MGCRSPLFAFFAGLAGYMADPGKGPVLSKARWIGEPLPDFALDPAFGGLPGAAKGGFRRRAAALAQYLGELVPALHRRSPAAGGAQGTKASRSSASPSATGPRDVANFLSRYGNPYSRIGSDRISEVQLEIGSSGVPETFVIDASGVIRYQHIGDIGEDDVAVLLAELEKAR